MPFDIKELIRLGREDAEREEKQKLGLYPSRSKLGEVAAGLYEGMADELPEAAARFVRGGNVAPEEQGPLDRWATGVIEEQQRDRATRLPSREVMQGNELHRSLYEGAKNVPYSLGLGVGGMVAGGVAGAATGLTAGPAAAVAGGCEALRSQERLLFSA